MTKSKPNPAVDWFFTKAKNWNAELLLLREIALSSGLSEDVKWGCPCYTLDGKNVVLIHAFKNYCAFLFFKGALMKDEKKVLIKQTEQVQGPRQIRFTSVAEIAKLKSSVTSYIKQAIELEKQGSKIEKKKISDYKLPDEFNKVLKQMPDLKKAFQSLTPGRQRAYLLHFSSAKQSSTREARIAKYLDKILSGKGMDG